MRVSIVYPVPTDALELFQPDMARFFSTLQEFDAGYPFDLVLVLSHYRRDLVSPTTDALHPYHVLRFPTVVLPYTGMGCDLGAHQHAAHSIYTDMMVCFSTRVHFHRHNWLMRLVETFSEFEGKGIFGPMGSYERQPHLRTCAYALSPALFRSYPWLINSRQDTFDCETGKWCLTKWVSDQGLPVRMVTWEGSYGMPAWRAGHHQNIYRRGDQSNCLVWDRHTELYAKASPEEKRKLEQYAGDK